MSIRLRLVLIIHSCFFLFGCASPTTYLTIDYFPLTYPNDTTPINSIIRASKTAIVCESYKPDKAEKCDAEWINYTNSTCSDWFLNTNSNGWYIAKVANENEFVAVSYTNEGGNGGDRIYWKLFYIPQFKLHYSCPAPIDQPEMSGVQVTEGGNVWYELECEKGEDFADCAERIFYPKSGATRLEFSSSGKTFKSVPRQPKIPEYSYQ